MFNSRGNTLTACLAGGVSLYLGALAAQAEGPKVGFLALPIDSSYGATLSQVIQDTGAAQGFSMLPTKAGQTNDPAEQIANMQTMIDSGVQGLIVQISDGKAMKTGLDAAKAAGVPVVTVDVSPYEGYGQVAMMVQVSNYELGKYACQELGKVMGGKGKILELQGDFQNIVAVDRSRGFTECMSADFPDITLLPKPANWSQDMAASITEAVLSTDPEVGGVFMAGDAVYISAVLNTMRRLDILKKVGEEGHIALVGIDGDPLALQAIRDGYADTIISQPVSDYGKWGAHYLAAVLKGETLAVGPTDHGSEIVQIGENLADVLKPDIVTAANVDNPQLWGNANLQPK